MNNRFFSPRHDNATVENPRRRIRLFSNNDRQRKEPANSSLGERENVTPDSSLRSDDPGTVSRKEVAPVSPKKDPPNSPKRTVNSASSLLARRNAPPTPLLDRSSPPPSLHSTRAPSASSSASRPGVSFQRNNASQEDRIAAKMSTFDNNDSNRMGSVHRSPSMIQDPVAAKIAAFDNNSSHYNNNSRRSCAVAPAPVAAQMVDKVTYMEIAPGEKVRLRGAKETWQCVENDFYLPTTCFSCDTDLCCIMDASYVLCPVCKVVSPVEGWAGGPDGGVGLGFTYDDLANWQREIVQRHQQQECY